MNAELDYLEAWKSVAHYEGLYEVSNLGRIRSLARLTRIRGGGLRELPGRILHPGFRGTRTSRGNGYLGVSLYKSGQKPRNAYVHDLVAEAFLGPRPILSQIDHVDGNKLNNFFGNLQYVSKSENMRRAAESNLMARGERHRSAKLTDAQVTEARRLRTEGMTHQAIANNFGVTRECISRILRGENRRRPTNWEGQEQS
jgi:hypothetical protein